MTLPAGPLAPVANPRYAQTLAWPTGLGDIASLARSGEARADIERLPGYRPTPLLELGQLAAQVGVASIRYKDESARFGLQSFKALGGAYAVSLQLRAAIGARLGRAASIDDLLERRYPEITADTVVSCATAGNHGRSVAWGCQMFACPCVIYLHRDVSMGRERALAALGADIVRVDGNYDDSVHAAQRDATTFGRIIVSDTSYPGYLDIPSDVARGYSVMLGEAVEQLAGEIPTHAFIQAGVGGLASAVCAYFWELWGERRPRFVCVEPERANCLQESIRAGAMTRVDGDLETQMAGLACGEVSLQAWRILETGIADALTLPEQAIASTMRLLAQNEPPIEAGESAVAGIAAALIAARDQGLAHALGIDRDSRIFVIGTEGATDPQVYRQMLGS